MKTADYLKLRETRKGADKENIVLVDLKVGSYNDKDYAVGETADGETYTFVADNFDSALEEGVISTNKEGDAVVPRKVTTTFDSTGISFIQIGEVRSWSAKSIKVVGE